MSKWADYCISAVQYNDARTHINKVQTTTCNSDSFTIIVEESRKTVISNINTGKTYITVFNKDGKWEKGQPVKVFELNRAEYIKTVDNEKEADNLENLPEF